MKNESASLPTVFIIFGATGDLTFRKLMPALYNLLLDGMLPEVFSIIGIARSPMEKEELLSKLKKGVVKFSRRKLNEEKWNPDYTKISTGQSSIFKETTLENQM